MKIIEYFDRAVRAYPGRPFLIDGDRVVSHADACRAVNGIAHVLMSAGVRAGDKVAIISPNTVEACESILGILRCGGVWVTLGAMDVAAAISRAIEATEIGVLLFSAAYKDVVKEVVASAPALRLVICMDGQLDGFPSLSDPPNLDARLTATVGETSHDPVTTIFASGGTTGDPKGVMMRASAWTQLVLSSSISVGHHHPVKLLVSPVFQTAGGVGFLSDLALGCTHVLLRRFDPDAIFFAIERYRVTYMFLAPTALNILLAQPDVSRYDYSSLRHLIYGGAPIASARVVEAMEVMGPVMATGFAQTETGGPVTFLSPREHSEFIQAGRLDRLSSCGRETLLSRVEVMNDDGDLLSAGEEGEVVVKSSHMMCGYYRSGMRMLDPDVDAERDWHRTGDVGTKDDEGYVFLLDRKKDMIISGAYNIYPAEIERFLEGQNGVCACAVVGAPDSTMGEVVRAVVELRPGASIDPRELVRICRENLPAMKTPSSIEIWRELPKNASGKVLRRQVREHFWAGRDRRI